MDLKLTAALLTGILAAQDPATPTPTQLELARHADLLPAEALVVVSTAPFAEQGPALRRTGLADLWTEVIDTPSGRLVREALAAWLDEHGNVDIEDLESLLTGGVAWAWIPDPTDLAGQWIAVFPAGAQRTEQVNGWLERLASRAGEVPAALRIEPLDTTVHGALISERLVLGSSASVVRQAIERAARPEATRLSGQPAYRDAREHLLLVEPHDPFASVWIDARSLLAFGLAEVPADARRQLTPWLDRLGFAKFGALSFVCCAGDDEIRERVLFQMPAPRPALVAALMPAAERPDPSLAALAPDDAVSFGTFQLDLGSLWTAVLAGLREDQPEIVDQVRGMLGMVGMQFGLDPERDLIHNLGPRWTSIGWIDDDEVPGQVLIADVRNVDTLRAALAGLPQHGTARDGSFEIFVPTGDAEGAAFALGHGRLAVAQNPTMLQHWLVSQRNPTRHAGIASDMQALTPHVTGFSWSRLDPETLRQFASMGTLAARQADLPTSIDPRSLVQGITPWLDSLTEFRQETLVDDRGFSVTIAAPAGVVTGLATTAAGALIDRLASEATLSDRIGQARAVEQGRMQEVRAAVVAIREAELRHRDQFGAFADLDELLARGTLPSGTLATARGRNLHGIGEHLATVILPEERSPSHFLVVAWPADEARGAVFAATDEAPARSNDLLAHQEGLARASLEDVLVGGEWTGPWTAGWKDLDTRRPASSSAATRPGTTPAPGAAALRSVVLQLETRGPTAAGELAEHLDADDPEIVARVAWCMGEFGHADAVPQLVRLATEHADAAVRRQSVAALRRLADERGLQASIDALDDDDAEVRTQAAATLGALGSQRAIDALIGFLATEAVASPEGTGAEGEAATDAPHRDRAAAILALADLEARDELGQLATSVSAPDDLESKALAFTFQKLTPTLGPDHEVELLMGVLDHSSTLLRRFAIQRLGELRDARSVAALERALGREDKALRPLIEVSLVEIRGAEPEPGNVATGADPASTANAEAPIWERVVQDPELRTPALAGVGGLLLLVITLVWWSRRRRRRADADRWAAMARPSEEWDDEASADGEWSDEDGEAWDDSGEYAEDYQDEYQEEYDDEYSDEYAEDDAVTPQGTFFQSNSDEVELDQDDQEFGWTDEEEIEEEWDQSRR